MDILLDSDDSPWLFTPLADEDILSSLSSDATSPEQSSTTSPDHFSSDDANFLTDTSEDNFILQETTSIADSNLVASQQDGGYSFTFVPVQPEIMAADAYLPNPQVYPQDPMLTYQQTSPFPVTGSEADRRRMKRMEKNRITAQRSRERKKAYMKDLEDENTRLRQEKNEVVAKLNSTLQENYLLKQHNVMLQSMLGYPRPGVVTQNAPLSVMGQTAAAVPPPLLSTPTPSVPAPSALRPTLLVKPKTAATATTLLMVFMCFAFFADPLLDDGSAGFGSTSLPPSLLAPHADVPTASSVPFARLPALFAPRTGRVLSSIEPDDDLDELCHDDLSCLRRLSPRSFTASLSDSDSDSDSDYTLPSSSVNTPTDVDAEMEIIESDLWSDDGGEELALFDVTFNTTTNRGNSLIPLHSLRDRRLLAHGMEMDRDAGLGQDQSDQTQQSQNGIGMGLGDQLLHWEIESLVSMARERRPRPSFIFCANPVFVVPEAEPGNPHPHHATQISLVVPSHAVNIPGQNHREDMFSFTEIIADVATVQRTFEIPRAFLEQYSVAAPHKLPQSTTILY